MRTVVPGKGDTVKHLVRTIACFGIVLLFGIPPEKTLHAQQPGQPYFICGERVECAYVLWDGHGNKNFVVEGPTSGASGALWLPTNFIGFHYCMDAGPPKMPTPKWPGCFHPGSNIHLHNSGIVKAGPNG